MSKINKTNICLTFLTLTLLINVTYSIDCTDEAWFVMVPIEKSILEQTILPPNFCLQKDHALKHLFDDGFHPVLFEFGKQNDCQQKYVPFFKTTFVEMKMEVPFVQTTDKGPNVFKPYIYVDSGMNNWSSYLFYGLPTQEADKMVYNSDFYSVEFKGMKMTAKFTNTEENWGSLAQYPNFNNYIEAVKTPWFCGLKTFNIAQCAENHYKWDKMKIRPASVELLFEGDILGKGLNGKSYKMDDITKSPIGAAQIVVPLSITFPGKCEFNPNAVCPDKFKSKEDI